MNLYEKSPIILRRTWTSTTSNTNTKLWSLFISNFIYLFSNFFSLKFRTPSCWRSVQTTLSEWTHRIFWCRDNHCIYYSDINVRIIEPQLGAFEERATEWPHKIDVLFIYFASRRRIALYGYALCCYYSLVFFFVYQSKMKYFLVNTQINLAMCGQVDVFKIVQYMCAVRSERNVCLCIFGQSSPCFCCEPALKWWIYLFWRAFTFHLIEW